MTKQMNKTITALMLAAALVLPGSAAASRFIGYKEALYMPSEGTAMILVLPIEFPDRPYPYDRAYWQAHFFGGIKDEWRPEKSLKTFFQQQSKGKLTIEGEILPLYQTQKNFDEYSHNNTVFTKEVVEEALAYYEAQGVDFSKFDGDSDGYVDTLAIQMSDSLLETFSAVGLTGIWDSKYRAGGMGIKLYNLTEYSYRTTSEQVIDIHEYGHVLGLDDHYRWPGLISTQDIMLGIGQSGKYMNAFDRYMLEWLEPEVISAADGVREIRLYPQELDQAEGAQAVILVPEPEKLPFTELYMVEYRQNGYLYIWRINAELSKHELYSPYADAVLPSGSYLNGVGKGAYYLNLVKMVDTSWEQQSKLIVSQNSLETGDFCGHVFSGVYIEWVESTEDYVVIRTGIEPDNGKAPVLQSASRTDGAVLEPDNSGVTLNYDTAVWADNETKCYYEDRKTGERIAAALSSKDFSNAISVVPAEKLAMSSLYTLVIPQGVVKDSAGNAAAEYRWSFATKQEEETETFQRRRWELKELQEAPKSQMMTIQAWNELSYREGHLFFGETDLGTMEETDQTSVWHQEDGCSVVLSQSKNLWLGTSQPVLSKLSSTGELFWQMEFPGELEDVTILHSDLSQYAFYAYRNGKTFQYQFYEPEEESECGVEASYETGHYREPVQDLTLSTQEGATILYTLDGSDPRLFGTVYSEPFTPMHSCKLRAVAKKNDIFSRECVRNYYFTSYEDQTPFMVYTNPNRRISSEKPRAAFVMGTANDGTFHINEDYQFAGVKYPEDFMDFRTMEHARQYQQLTDSVLTLNRNGTVYHTGDENFRWPEQEDENPYLDETVMQDVIQIQTGVILKKDGSVHEILFRYEAEGATEQCPKIDTPENVVQLAETDRFNRYLLLGDGTVFKVEREGLESIGWHDIVDLKIYNMKNQNAILLGLDKNGTLWWYRNRDKATVRVWENIERFEVDETLIATNLNGETLAVPMGEFGIDDTTADIREKTYILTDEPLATLVSSKTLTGGIRGDGSLFLKGRENEKAIWGVAQEWNLLPRRQVEICEEAVEIQRGEIQQIPFSFDWIDRMQIEWSSSDPAVVQVDPAGRIRGVQSGTAVISAASKVDAQAIDSVVVTVTGEQMPCEMHVAGKNALEISSVDFAGNAVIMVGYFEGETCKEVKSTKFTLQQGGQVRVPIVAAQHGNQVKCYLWTDTMEPLAYPVTWNP